MLSRALAAVPTENVTGPSARDRSKNYSVNATPIVIMAQVHTVLSGVIEVAGHRGAGIAVAVLLALTPALMTLLGRYNWVGPRWARRAGDRLWQT